MNELYGARLRRLHRVGNSLVIAVPREVREAIGLERGDWVRIYVGNDRAFSVVKVEPREVRDILIPTIDLDGGK